jgi:hypothetical protein
MQTAVPAGFTLTLVEFNGILSVDFFVPVAQLDRALASEAEG